MITGQRKCIVGAVLALLLVQLTLARPTPVGSVFTYQGQLKQGGNPVNATVDFQFRLFDVAEFGFPIGGTYPVDNVIVADGQFTADIDFGALAFNGNARWLEISVRTPAGSGVFTLLTPRQPIRSVPVAQFALAVDGPSLTNISASNITSGTINVAQMPAGGNWALSSALNLDSNSLVVDAANNRVGIGTATPNALLEVAGSARFSGNGGFSIGGDFNQTRIDAGGAGFQLFRFLSSVNTYTGLRARQASIGGNFGDIDSPSGGLIVQGNVGIGTSTPLLALDVFGSSGPAATSGSSANGIIRVKPSATSAILDIGGTGSPAHAWLQSRDSANYALNYNLALNPNGGSVGIGTFTPDVSYSLTAKGSGTGLPVAGTVYRAGGSAGVSLSFPGPTDTANFDIWNSNAGWLRFGTNGVERVRMDAAGNVGVGTASPATRFHVQSGATGTPFLSESLAVFESSSASGTAVSIVAPDAERTALWFGKPQNQVSGGFTYNAANTNSLNVFTNGSARMSVTGTGNVGIGTTNPTGRLHVSGTADTTSVVLPNNAISDSEIADEPGLTSYKRNPALVNHVTMGVQSFGSSEINCPASGYVLAIVSAAFESETTGTVIMGFGASLNPNSLPDAEANYFEPDSSREVTTVQSVHAVSAGTHEFYIVAGHGSEGVSMLMHAPRITLIYLPTAYGTVDTD